MPSVLRAALISALYLGCAASQPVPGARASRPGASVASESWRVVRYPAPPESVSLAEHAADGTDRVLTGGWRAELRGDRVILAEQATLDPLVRSCAADHGFLHFSEGGGLFWSSVFLGPLEAVGRLEHDFAGRIVQCGPLVVARSRDGRLGLVVSRTGIRQFAGFDIRLANFSTAERGRALAPPDRLLETQDGGRSFVEITTRPGAELDQPVAWLGAEPSVPMPFETSWEETHGAEANRVRKAWLSRAVTSDVGRVTGGLALGDGTWARTLALSGSAKMLVAFRAPSGSVIEHEVVGATRALPWGGRLLVDQHGWEHGLRSLGPEGLAAVPAPPRAASVLVADANGRWIGAGSMPQDGAGQSSLMIYDGERWREYALAARPLAIGSGWLMVRRAPGRQLALLSLADPERDARELGSALREEPAFSFVDGALVQLGRLAATGPNSLIWRDLETAEPRGVHPTPDWLVGIGFADERHGVGIASDAALSVTSDGGRTFVPVPLASPVRGPPSTIRCWSRGCAFAGAVAFTDEPTRFEPQPSPNPISRIEEPPAAGPSDAGVLPAVPVPQSTMDAWRPRYRCRATPSLESAGGLRAAAQASSALRMPAIAGAMQRRGEILSWSGADAKGEFRVETPPLRGPGRAMFEGKPALVGSKLIAAEISGVLVARSYAVVFHRTAADARVFVVRGDGNTDSLLSAPRIQAQARPLPAGAAVVLAGAPGRQEVFLLDGNGTLQARRWFIGTAGYLAVGPRGAGLFDAGRENTKMFSLERGSPGLELPLRLEGAFRTCARAAVAAGAYVLSVSPPELQVDGEYIPRPDFGGGSPGSTSVGLLELSASGGCFRGALVSEPFPIEIHAEGGSLRGTLVGPKRSHALSCREE